MAQSLSKSCTFYGAILIAFVSLILTSPQATYQQQPLIKTSLRPILPPESHQDLPSTYLEHRNRSTSITSFSIANQTSNNNTITTRPQTGRNINQVRERWNKLESSLDKSLQSISSQLKVTLEELLSSSSQIATQQRLISSPCRLALNELVTSLGEQQLWASQTLDASARLPAGLLEGTLTELGNFDQCLSISHQLNINSSTTLNELLPIQKRGQQQQQQQLLSGQYCSLLIKPPLPHRPRLHTVCQRLPSLHSQATSSQANSSQAALPSRPLRLLSQNSHQFHYVGLRLGICLPSTCSRSDVQLLLAAYLAKYELLGQVKSCQVAADTEQPFDLTQQCILIVFSILICLVVLGTCVDSLTRASNDQASGRPLEARISGHGDDEHLDGDETMENKVCSNSYVPIDKRAQLQAGKRWRDYQVYRTAYEPSDSCLNSQPLGLQRNPLAELAAVSPSMVVVSGQPEQSELADNNTPDQEAEEENGGGLGEEEEAWIAQLERNQREAIAAAEAAARKMNLSRTTCCGANLTSQAATRARNRSDRNAMWVVHSFLVCFSLRTNLEIIGKHVSSSPTAKNLRRGQQVGDTEDADAEAEAQAKMGDIKVIHGLRTITMVWIIFGHTIGLVSPEMMNNLFSLAQLSCSSRILQALLNATLAVNTFFMISGLVTVISFARRCSSALVLISPKGSGIAIDRTTRDAKHGCFDEDEEVSSVDSSSIVSSLASSSASSNRCIHHSDGRATTVAPVRDCLMSVGRKKSVCKQLARDKHNAKKFGPQLSPSAEQKVRRGLASTTTTKATTTNGDWPADFKPLLWLIMRYLRLTPAYAAVIGVSILMPSLGSGPFWQESAGQMGPACRQSWWLNLLYVNNFIDTDKLCLIHSWYLSNDYQFFLIALILFATFYKSKQVAVLILISMFAASSAATFTLTVTNDFPPTIVTTSPAVAERWQFIHSLYYKPWPHLPSYLVGLVAGYCILIKDRLQMSTLGRTIGWLLFALTSLSLLNSVYPWNMGLQVEPLLTGLHSATFRTLWATCCAWLVFALASRPQNLLARLLSWHGFQISSRLTYCAYLVHPLIIYYHFGTLRERMDSSVYGQFHRFVATLGLSYLFALLLSLFVESPSIQMQHFLSQLSSKPRPTVGLACGKQCKRASESSATTSSWMVSSSFGDQNSASSLVATTTQHANKCESFKMLPTAPNTILGGRRHHDHKNNHYHHHHQHHSTSDKSDASVHSATEAVYSSEHLPHKHGSSLAPPNLVQVEDQQLLSGNNWNLSGRNGLSRGVESNGGELVGKQANSALDAEFQRKLAQAISRGFRIRSRLANGVAKQGGAQQRNHLPSSFGAANRGAQIKRLPSNPGSVLAPAFFGNAPLGSASSGSSSSSSIAANNTSQLKVVSCANEATAAVTVNIGNQSSFSPSLNPKQQRLQHLSTFMAPNKSGSNNCMANIGDRSRVRSRAGSSQGHNVAIALNETQVQRRGRSSCDIRTSSEHQEVIKNRENVGRQHVVIGKSAIDQNQLGEMIKAKLLTRSQSKLDVCK